MIKEGDKKGQLAIYIIVGVVIIAVVILFLLLRGGIIPNPLGTSELKNADEFLSDCMADKVNEAAVILCQQGGYLKPELFIKFLFTDEGKAYDVAYLCYSNQDYIPCVVQQPVLISHIGKEIGSYIKDESESCFDSLIRDYKSAGYETAVKNDKGYEVRLEDDRVIIDFKKDLKLTKADQTVTQKDFKAIVPNKIGKLALVAVEVINREIQSCEFDYIAFTKFYPEYSIDKHTTSDGVEVYTIKDYKTGQMFRFAVRGCFIPPTY